MTNERFNAFIDELTELCQDYGVILEVDPDGQVEVIDETRSVNPLNLEHWYFSRTGNE